MWDSVFLNLYGAHVQEFQTFISKFNGLLRITFGLPPCYGQRVTVSVLRAERSAAALRFARNTGGQVCLTLQSETIGEEDHHHSLELMLMHGLHRRERKAHQHERLLV